MVIVGHAPGIPALAHLLADESSVAAARAVIAYRYPPATLATLHVHGSWAKLRTASLATARIAPNRADSAAQAPGTVRTARLR